VNKPVNFDELCEFWKRVARDNPWPTTTFGGHTEKGFRIGRQMTQEELVSGTHAAADELGLVPPKPIFEEEE